MIEISLWLAVTQWVLLLALGYLLWMLYRHLAGLLHGHIETNLSRALPVGKRAPSFRGERLDPLNGEHNSLVSTVYPDQEIPLGGQRTILVFGDPHCASCQDVFASVAALGSEPEFSQVRRVIVTTSGESLAANPEILGVVEAYRVSHDVFDRLYGVTVTPTVFCLTSDGNVAGRGVPRDLTELRRIASCLLSTAETVDHT